MGGAELILGPVVLLTGVLAGVILGVDTVNVLEPVAVTASMEQRGLSSEVVTHRLITRLAQIADLESEFHEIGGKDMAGEGFTESLAEAVGMGEIVLAARRLPGSVEAEFRPEFVERGDGTILRLRILRPQTGVHLVHEFKVEGYPIEPTLREASRAIFVMVDPVALAMDDLWRGDLVAARQSVERALHMSGGRERQVAEMLRGIQQLAEDDAAAAERTLRTALLHRQDFAPARLALAMALARTSWRQRCQGRTGRARTARSRSHMVAAGGQGSRSRRCLCPCPAGGGGRKLGRSGKGAALGYGGRTQLRGRSRGARQGLPGASAGSVRRVPRGYGAPADRTRHTPS